MSTRYVDGVANLPKLASAKIIRYEEIPVDTNFERDLKINHAVNDETCGAKRLSVSRSVIPPGKVNERHIHANCETTMFILKGCPLLFMGEEAEEIRVTPGTFVYIPENFIHGIGNPDKNETVELIVSTSVCNKDFTGTIMINEPNFPRKGWDEVR